MKKIISLALAALMLSSVFAVPSMAAETLTDKTVSFDKAAWTAREVPADKVVTLKPDYSDDINVETSVIKNGGFESEQGWSDALNTLMFWMDGGGEGSPWQPWVFTTEDKLEGEKSVYVDLSPAMAALSESGDRYPIMAFQGVFVEPCFGDQVYHLQFFTKVDKPLGFEDPQFMVYMLDTGEDGVDAFANTEGTKNVMISSSMIDYHWYDQNEVRFEQGQNPGGAFDQCYGPFSQGKWIQIDAYFKTPEDFAEGAYSIQLQTQSGADCKLYFDGFSLTKETMADVDLGIALVGGDKESSSKKLAFAKKSVKVKKGKKATLKLKNATKKTKFSVDKKGKKVVKLLNKKGKTLKIKGLKKGKATITAKLGKKKATCKVTVK